MIKRVLGTLGIGLLVLMLAACGGPRVRYDMNASHDFSTFTAWKFSDATWAAEQDLDDLTKQRYENSARSALIALGLPEKNDASWTVSLIIEDRQRITDYGSSISFGLGAGRRGCYGGMAVNTGSDIRDYDERTLAMVLTNEAQEVWIGQAAWSLNARSPEKMEAEAQKGANAVAAKLQETALKK
jgi:hypothetical protein